MPASNLSVPAAPRPTTNRPAAAPPARRAVDLRMPLHVDARIGAMRGRPVPSNGQRPRSSSVPSQRSTPEFTGLDGINFAARAGKFALVTERAQHHHQLMQTLGSPHHADGHGHNALHRAAHAGPLESVIALLACGLDPMQRAKDGLNAIDFAAAMGRFELIDRMLPDADLPREDWFKLMDEVCKRGDPEFTVKMLERAKCAAPKNKWNDHDMYRPLNAISRVVAHGSPALIARAPMLDAGEAKLAAVSAPPAATGRKPSVEDRYAATMARWQAIDANERAQVGPKDEYGRRVELRNLMRAAMESGNFKIAEFMMAECVEKVAFTDHLFNLDHAEFASVFAEHGDATCVGMLARHGVRYQSAEFLRTVVKRPLEDGRLALLEHVADEMKDRPRLLGPALKDACQQRRVPEIKALLALDPTDRTDAQAIANGNGLEAEVAEAFAASFRRRRTTGFKVWTASLQTQGKIRL